MPDPTILLVSEQHADLLLDEFGRYQRDYDLRTARSCAEALAATEEVVAAGGTVALFVADSRLPDAHVLEALGEWRSVVPTARRLITASFEHFMSDAEELRPGLAKGKYDAYLLMPRGVRDEEFHNAVTDLLSDWGATVPDPEVVSVKIISPAPDQLTLAIRTSWTGWGCRAASTTRRARRASTSASCTGRSRRTRWSMRSTARRWRRGRCATSR